MADHVHTSSCSHNHPQNTNNNNSPLLQQYLHQASRNPASEYQFLTEHPEIVTQANIDALEQMIISAVQEAKGYLAHQNSNASEKHDVFAVAKFFHFKKTVLMFSLKYGVEKFFSESLCSSPPDDIVMEFQRELVEFPKTYGIEKENQN